MGEPAKPALAPSTNLPNFESVQTVAQPHAPPGLRVLVADDHEMVRVGLCAMLESRQIEVCAEAKNGEEAVDKSSQLSPDLIIVDISIPVLAAIEADQRIQACLPDFSISSV